MIMKSVKVLRLKNNLFKNKKLQISRQLQLMSINSYKRIMIKMIHNLLNVMKIGSRFALKKYFLN